MPIIQGPSSIAPTRQKGLTNIYYPTGWVNQGSPGNEAFDLTRQWGYFPITGTDLNGNTSGGIEVIDLSTMQTLSVTPLWAMYQGTSYGSPAGQPPTQGITELSCGRNTDLFANIGNRFTRIDPNSMKVTGDFFQYFSFSTPPPVTYCNGFPGRSAVNIAGSHTIVAYGAQAVTWSLEIFDGTTMLPDGIGAGGAYGNGATNSAACAGKSYPADSTCDFIYFNGDGSLSPTGNIEIWKINVSESGAIISTRTGVANVAALIGAGQPVAIPSAMYDSLHDCFVIGINTGVNNNVTWVSVNYNGSINGHTANFAMTALSGKGQDDLSGGTFAFGGGNAFTLINTATGATIFTGTIQPTSPPILIPGADYSVWDSVNNHLFTYAASQFQLRIDYVVSYTNIIGPPPTYLHFLTCCDRAIMAHLYEFHNAAGTAVDYFTDFDIPIFYQNVLWKANSLRFEGLQRKIGIGVAIDEQTLKIWSSPTDTIFGGNFLSGAEEGLLDGTLVRRRRIIWEFVTGNVMQDILNPPLYEWTLFTGFMGQIAKGGASHVEFKVKSALEKLSVNMPRNYYQPGCLWTLYDQGCLLPKQNYAFHSTVLATDNVTVAPVGGVNPAFGPDGLPFFAQGRLLFNSGVNAGLQVLIDANDTVNLLLAYPLSALPSPGDSITFYPGCSKTFNTCKVKFNNTDNFRGFDKVPPVFISV